MSVQGLEIKNSINFILIMLRVISLIVLKQKKKEIQEDLASTIIAFSIN